MEFILESMRSEEIHSCLILIRDLSIKGAVNSSHEEVDEFRELISKSDIFSKLNNLLYQHNLFVRKDVIYTIGKIYFKQNANMLAEAYKFYRKTDPLIIPDILFELSWLTNRDIWSFIDELIKDNHFLFRWSAVDLLHKYNKNDNKSNKFIDSLVLLSNDDNIYVSNEAKELLKRSCMTKQISEFDEENLSITFLRLVIDFCNYQKTEKIRKYSIEDIEDYIKKKYEFNKKNE